jgi:tetratricopeptide (TPR) repeat protein
VADVRQRFAEAEAAWRAGRGDDARISAEQVLALDPAHTGALMLLTNLAFAAGDIAGAAPYLKRLAAVMPDDMMIRDNLGRAYLAAEDLEAAADAFSGILRREPDNARALDGLGIARHRQGDYSGAAQLHQQASEVDPAFAAAWCNLGIALTDLGRFDDGAAALDRALDLDPQDARTQFNRSILSLMAGDFARGWPLYEARLAFQGGPSPAGQRWRGEPLSGERVLLTPEQGFGDVIQFARFADRVGARGGVPVLAVPEALAALIDAQGWDVETAPAEAPPETPYWCPLMSLGAVLDLGPADIGGAPYVAAPASAGTPGGKTRVGFVWAGNPNHRRDRDRSLRLADLAPVLAVPGIDAVNLQVGLRAGDSEELARHPELFAETPGLGDFADTANQLAGLDLLISADTAVLHLAGAMGRPAWGLIPFVPDWRWGKTGASTDWYDSLRLYRQGTAGDWAAVIGRVAADLEAMAA